MIDGVMQSLELIYTQKFQKAGMSILGIFNILIDQLPFLIPIVHYDQINRIISFNL